MALESSSEILSYSQHNASFPSPWIHNARGAPFQHSDLVNLPSYVVPVLCSNQCNQCTLPTSNMFLSSDSQYHMLEDEARYFNELVAADGYYDQYPRPLYLDQFPSSFMEMTPIEVDHGTYSVRSLYRAQCLNSTGTDLSLDPDFTETTSEFDTAIMSLDPSTCFSMYEESLLFRDDTPRRSDRGVMDNEEIDEDIVYMQDVSEQAQIDSEEANPPPLLDTDDTNAQEGAGTKKATGYGHGRLVKIFFEYFISSLVTINAYFYNYFLRYLLFI